MKTVESMGQYEKQQKEIIRKTIINTMENPRKHKETIGNTMATQ